MAILSPVSLFGILGNIVAFMVYLAPLPTFYKIVKEKSTQGFQSIPYSVSLFSAVLYLYYGVLRKRLLIITINSFGCVIQTSYLTIYMFYATKESKVFTGKLLLLFNVLAQGIIISCTNLFSYGDERVSIVGWIGAVFNVCTFAAPLSIMRQVIKTKSVEFMPFSLSFSLTLCATVWFVYGFLIKDFYVAAPNILGFIFGIAQMILYVVYKNKRQNPNEILDEGSKSTSPKKQEMEITFVS